MHASSKKQFLQKDCMFRQSLLLVPAAPDWLHCHNVRCTVIIPQDSIQEVRFFGPQGMSGLDILAEDEPLAGQPKDEMILVVN